MRVLITGAAGMLGRRVLADAAARGWDAVGIDLPDADLTDEGQTIAVIGGHAPDAIVHCAAWVDVDGAEEREADALRVNEAGSRNVGRAAAKVGARVVAVSTDYVFNGTLTGRPYVESDPVAPLGAYGRTKHAGELALAAELENHAIARTAWLFGWPGKSFPDTMLRAGAARDSVSVVTDQVGSPTWTGHLSPALLDLAAGTITGPVHTAGGGQCSWHELTVELYRQAGVVCAVEETTSADFVRGGSGAIASRPAWSVMATQRADLGAPVLPAWHEGVAGYLTERNSQ